MAEIPTPILIFGDEYLSRNNIVATKKNHPDIEWVTMSASKDTLDDIRAEVGMEGWLVQDKVVIIEDIPNKKDVREFILDVAVNCPTHTKLIVLDSNNHIKVDPKTQKFGKTWAPFVKSFKEISGCKVINNGEKFTEKTGNDASDFVKKEFAKEKIKIGSEATSLLISIVGYGRGLLASEVEKLCLTCPNPVTSEFITDNAFPTASEAIIYKFSNSIDTGNYSKAINSAQEFTKIFKIDANVLIDIMFKKARWQLVVAYYYHGGTSWGAMADKLMEMGKSPSYVWNHPSLSTDKKKTLSDQYGGKEGSIADFLIKKQGVPEHCFKHNNDKNKPRSESIPMKFMAQQIVSFVQNKIVNPHMNDELVKDKVLNRAMLVYSGVYEKLVAIRKGQNKDKNIEEAIKLLVSTNPYNFD